MSDHDRLELQLGHLCNNRCVFCVSGKLTHERRAPLLAAEPLLATLRDARARGARSVTLLGGEPTIQPVFLEIVREAVRLGFDEIVVFSNGSAPSRTQIIDRVLATGGHFEWRFSFQGGTREAHEATTRRRGSFAQLLRSVDRARARDQRVTVNLCVVRSNYESLPALGALLAPRGVAQVHVDMLNPYDTGDLAEAEVRALQPRYSELAPALERYVASFPEGFDVNVGNLPYCVAPTIAPHIHHGGRPTWTVTADDFGGTTLAQEKNKYLVKSSRRTKPASCAACLFDASCSGVFDLYRAWFGDEEFLPVSEARLDAADPAGTLVAPRLRAWLGAELAALPSSLRVVTVDERDLRCVTLHFTGPDPAVRLLLRVVAGRGGVASTDRHAIEVLEHAGPRRELLRALEVALAALAHGGAVRVPAGEDAFTPPAAELEAPLARLRDAAPFGALRWCATRVDRDGSRVELDFAEAGAEAAAATVWLALTPSTVRRPTSSRARATIRAGYGLPPSAGTPARSLSEALREGLGGVIAAVGLPTVRTSGSATVEPRVHRSR